jgi:hypothetical protein
MLPAVLLLLLFYFPELPSFCVYSDTEHVAPLNADKGLPGKRVEAKRAGIMITTLIDRHPRADSHGHVAIRVVPRLPQQQ